VYAQSILYSVAKETLKAATGISKELLSKDANAKTYSSWLRTATEQVGWHQTRKAIETVGQILATTAAAKTVVVPVVLAGAEFQSARSTMKAICGVHPHFLTPIDTITYALIASAASSSGWISDKAKDAAETVVVGGNTLTKLARRGGSWLADRTQIAAGAVLDGAAAAGTSAVGLGRTIQGWVWPANAKETDEKISDKSK
jgi:hypothetical protein